MWRNNSYWHCVSANKDVYDVNVTDNAGQHASALVNNRFDSSKTIYLSTAYELEACCYNLNYRKIKAVSFLK